MKRNSIFAFLCCKIKHEMYILKFPNECPLTRPGTILVFGKEYILFSLFNSLLLFFFSATASITDFYDCIIIPGVLQTLFLIVFDHSEHITV